MRNWKGINVKVIIKVIGFLLVIEGFFMLLGLPFSIYYGEHENPALLYSALITMLTGGILWVFHQESPKEYRAQGRLCDCCRFLDHYFSFRHLAISFQRSYSQLHRCLFRNLLFSAPCHFFSAGLFPTSQMPFSKPCRDLPRQGPPSLLTLSHCLKAYCFGGV